MGRISDIFLLLGYVALATTLVAHPGTKDVINAGGNAFSNSVKAAVGS